MSIPFDPKELEIVLNEAQFFRRGNTRIQLSRNREGSGNRNLPEKAVWQLTGTESVFSHRRSIRTMSRAHCV